MLSSAIGRQLLESQTLRHGTLLQDILGSQLDWDWDRASFFAVRFPVLFGVQLWKHSAVDQRGILPLGLMRLSHERWHLRPWADTIWLETKTPDLKQTCPLPAEFARNSLGNGWSTTSVRASTGVLMDNRACIVLQLNLPHDLLFELISRC